MLVWPDALTGIEPCMLCGGTGFICERHQAYSAGHEQCDAAGIPCPICRAMARLSSSGPRAVPTPALVQCSVCEEYQPTETMRWFTQPRSKGDRSYPTTATDPLGVAFCTRCAARREIEVKEFRPRWMMFED